MPPSGFGSETAPPPGQLPTGDMSWAGAWNLGRSLVCSPDVAHATLTVYKTVIVVPAEPLNCARGWVRTTTSAV
jgi:hypothetical protein